MRWLKNPGRSVRSGCLKKADDGNGPANHGVGKFCLADRVEPGSDEKAGSKPDDFACGVPWERFHGGGLWRCPGLPALCLWERILSIRTVRVPGGFSAGSSVIWAGFS